MDMDKVFRELGMLSPLDSSLGENSSDFFNSLVHSPSSTKMANDLFFKDEEILMEEEKGQNEISKTIRLTSVESMNEKTVSLDNFVGNDDNSNEIFYSSQDDDFKLTFEREEMRSKVSLQSGESEHSEDYYPEKNKKIKKNKDVIQDKKNTKNMLITFRKYFISFISRYIEANATLDIFKMGTSTNMHAYDCLFKDPLLRPAIAKMFSSRHLQRSIQCSRATKQQQCVYIEKIATFQKAFLTMNFTYIK